MMKSLTDVPASALTARLYEIRTEERALLVEFLHYLNELDRRKTVLELGFSSLFVFCTGHLGLSNGTAYRRTAAARLLARFPILAEYLADGRLTARTAALLRDVLDEERLIEVLDRAAGRTEEQVKELVASLRPQPAQPDLFRKLPSPATSRRGAVEQSHEVGKQRVLPLAPVPPPPPPPHATIEPIAPELHVMRVTVSGDFKADLQAVRDALSHTMPGAGLEEVLHECIRVTLAAIQKRRQGAGKKTEVVMPRRGSPDVPAPIRHAVWKRDGAGGCTYVAPDGRRCGSRHRLQVHHIDPRGMGGPPTVDNLALRCQAHNLYAARVDYGAEHIERAMRRASRRARES